MKEENLDEKVPVRKADLAMLYTPVYDYYRPTTSSPWIYANRATRRN